MFSIILTSLLLGVSSFCCSRYFSFLYEMGSKASKAESKTCLDMSEAERAEFESLKSYEEDCKKAFKRGGVEACRQYLIEMRDKWKTIPLNVAVVGCAGVGKSSFINAIRDLTADDEGAATVGATETTMGIKAYPHPDNSLLKFWDLPGVGTAKFPKRSYLEQIKVERFDFFLLMTASRFTENDTWLGQEITKRGKTFLFVRTKIGIDVSSDNEAHPRTHDEEQLLDGIRQNICNHLEQIGCQESAVFLIDNHQKSKFEFTKLKETLIADFPQQKQQSLVMSLSASSKKMIELKIKQLRLLLLPIAFTSGAVAIAPVPGLSVAVDIGLVIGQSLVNFRQLGLDEKSLMKHARATNTPPEDLQMIVHKTFSPEFVTMQGMKALIQTLGICSVVAVSAAVEEVARFVPFIGSLVSASLSFGTTFGVLWSILNKMRDVSLEVVLYAAEHGSY